MKLVNPATKNWCAVAFNRCCECQASFTSRWPRDYCGACAITRKLLRDRARTASAAAVSRPGFKCQACGAAIGIAHGDKRRRVCSAWCKEKVRPKRARRW